MKPFIVLLILGMYVTHMLIMLQKVDNMRKQRDTAQEQVRECLEGK